jgi:hypothetical protein
MTDDSRLAVLGKFTPEGVLTPGYGDSFLFLVGKDDVHSILHYLLTGEKVALKLSMFGFDDEQLNEDIMALMKSPNIRVQATLDKSQAGGVHEKKIIAMDEASNPDFLNSFAIGESATHQINHTKASVLIGQGIWFEGSTNWSSAGEGTGISLSPGIPDPKGYKSQNNTLLVSTNASLLVRFGEQLDKEHLVAQAQMLATQAKATS